MDRLHGILVFQRVVESGSLSGAARALGVSTAAVSAALARLERKLAARLLNRTTRRLGVTAEGAEFYARCKQITTELEEAELLVGRAGRVPSGRLRVGMPSTLGRLRIVPRLAEFARRYPAVGLELVFSDFVPYTIEDGLDVSVQVGEPHSSRLAARRLASFRYLTCASPDYLSERGAPRSPEELVGHACLTYRRPRNGRVREWRFRGGGSERQVAVNGVMTFNSGDALVAAAVAGLGIIHVAEYYARAALDDGRLVEILREHAAPAGHEIYAVYPAQSRVAPKVRAFVDFLVSVFDSPTPRKTAAARRAPARAS